jgi:hypothetical protein
MHVRAVIILTSQRTVVLHLDQNEDNAIISGCIPEYNNYK